MTGKKQDQAAMNNVAMPGKMLSTQDGGRPADAPSPDSIEPENQPIQLNHGCRAAVLAVSVASNLNGGLPANIATGSSASGNGGPSRFNNSVLAAAAEIVWRRAFPSAAVLPPGQDGICQADALYPDSIKPQSQPNQLHNGGRAAVQAVRNASSLNGGLPADTATGSGASGYGGQSRFHYSVPATVAYPIPGCHIGGQRVEPDVPVLVPSLQTAAMDQGLPQAPPQFPVARLDRFPAFQYNAYEHHAVNAAAGPAIAEAFASNRSFMPERPAPYDSGKRNGWNRRPDKECANCGTKVTPLWRRSVAGEPVCNACALYFKQNNANRPSFMKNYIPKDGICQADAVSPYCIKPQSQQNKLHNGSRAAVQAVSIAFGLNEGLPAYTAAGSGASGYGGQSRFFNSVPATVDYPIPGGHIGMQGAAPDVPVLDPGLQTAAMDQGLPQAPPQFPVARLDRFPAFQYNAYEHHAVNAAPGQAIAEAFASNRSFIPERPAPNDSGKRSGWNRRTDKVCANCGTEVTTLWRLSAAGERVCNACGLYFKQKNANRPSSMKNDILKRRKRESTTREKSAKASVSSTSTGSATLATSRGNRTVPSPVRTLLVSLAPAVSNSSPFAPATHDITVETAHPSLARLHDHSKAIGGQQPRGQPVQHQQQQQQHNCGLAPLEKITVIVVKQDPTSSGAASISSASSNSAMDGLVYFSYPSVYNNAPTYDSSAFIDSLTNTSESSASIASSTSDSQPFSTTPTNPTPSSQTSNFEDEPSSSTTKTKSDESTQNNSPAYITPSSGTDLSSHVPVRKYEQQSSAGPLTSMHASADSLNSVINLRVSSLNSASVNHQSHVKQARFGEMASCFVPASLGNGVSENHLVQVQSSSPSAFSVMKSSDDRNTKQNLVSGTQNTTERIDDSYSQIDWLESYISQELSKLKG